MTHQPPTEGSYWCAKEDFQDWMYATNEDALLSGLAILPYFFSIVRYDADREIVCMSTHQTASKGEILPVGIHLETLYLYYDEVTDKGEIALLCLWEMGQ